MKTTEIIKIITLTSGLLCYPLIYVYANSISPSNSEIVSTIKNKYSEDKTLSDLPINISSKLGVVTLSGVIHSKQEATRLIAIAGTTPGVENVNASKLVVEANPS
jgi:hypothetical protein